VRPEVQTRIEPLIVSWGYGATLETTTGSRFIDLLQWTGTKDPSAALAVPEAIRFMQAHQWEEVRGRCHELLRWTLQEICHLTGLDPVYPLDSDFYSQMGVAVLPRSDSVLLKRRLYDEYRIEVPLTEWQGRQFIRVSVQGYNSQEDVERLLEALKVLLPKVRVD
jgi:isopenicillin-N epimerase